MKKGRGQKRQLLSRNQVSVQSEVQHIVDRARNHDSRVVTLGSLVFFSTETGDAWMLDPEDGLALCLARDGIAQSVYITETAENFSIEWNSTYQIDREAFVVAEKSGRIRSIFGYPTEDLVRMIDGIKRTF